MSLQHHNTTKNTATEPHANTRLNLQRDVSEHAVHQHSAATQLGNVAERTHNHNVVAPRADIFETADSIQLKLDMPGIRDSDLHVTLEQDLLTIDGTQAAAAAALAVPPEHNPVYNEFELCDYRRQFTLLTQVNRDNIQASLKNGVLTLVLAKVAPARAHKIEVKAG